MAEIRGIVGVVKVGHSVGGTDESSLTALLNVTSFTLEESVETIDVTSMGDTRSITANDGSTSQTVGHRQLLPSFVTVSGTIDGFMDNASISTNDLAHDASNQPVIRAGQEIVYELYPEGEGTGKLYYEGRALITSVSRSQSIDGASEYSIAFEAQGGQDYSVDA